MEEYEKKLVRFLQENSIRADHIRFEKSCHSVHDAAEAANISIQDLVKNICMIDSKGELIVAIVKGEDKVDPLKVAHALGIKELRMATAKEILEKTGYPCGGVPSFGYRAKFVIDSKVMERQIVYSGGGSEKSLVRISTIELQRANGGIIAAIQK
jgi:prolyl-tRNA editing enzyme YbaK/EbsC (Cys-tRNA(Pro) deacylase)